ncbi:hypothetical protein SAMN05216356_1098 [Oribacterium sp. WCC10]|nr:hypothetical protein SAMN05216356_1098 [Oribacterium sp. WCC10]
MNFTNVFFLVIIRVTDKKNCAHLLVVESF